MTRLFGFVVVASLLVATAAGTAQDVKLDGPGKAVLGVEIKSEFQAVKGWKGLEITHVVSGSLAEAIGLKKADLIISICGQRIKSFDDLVCGMVKIRPDRKNGIVVVRNEAEKTFLFDSKDTSFREDNIIFVVVGNHNKYASKTDILGAVVNGKHLRNVHISNVLGVVFCEKVVGSSKTTIIIGFIKTVDGRSVDFLI